MKRLAPVLVSICWSGAAAAEDGRWELVFVGGGNTVVSIDRTTIHSDGGVVSVWVQYTQDTGSEIISYKRVAKVLQREEYVCRQMTSSLVSYAKFAENGEGLDSGVFLGQAARPIVPETSNEAVWRKVCGS